MKHSKFDGKETIIWCRRWCSDLRLLALLLLLGGLMVLGARLVGREVGAQVVVRVGGEVAAVFPLSADTQYEIRSTGGTNQLVIENGRACILYATCPDKLCVKQGSVQYGGESLICLPHQVIVEIISEAAEAETALDGVVG